MNQKHIKITILAMSSLIMLPALVAVTLADIAQQFTQISVSGVQFVLTLIMLASLTAVLLSGKLVQYFTKKQMILAALVLIAVGGMIGLLFHTKIAYLYCAGIVIGLGHGTIMTNSSSLVADYFQGDERSALMGQQSAMIGCAGTLLLLLAGGIASLAWYATYCIFLLAVPIFFIVKMYLPKGEIVRKNKHEPIKILNRRLVYYCVLIFCFATCQYTFATNVAMLITHSGFGNASSSGLATACFSGAGILSGLFLGRIIRVLKHFTIPLGVFSVVCGLYICFLSLSLPMVVLGGLLVGSGVGLILPTGNVFVSESVPPAGTTMAIAAFTASNSTGLFLSPIIINSVTALRGASDVHARYLTAAILATVLVTAVLLIETRMNKNSSQHK